MLQNSAATKEIPLEFAGRALTRHSTRAACPWIDRSSARKLPTLQVKRVSPQSSIWPELHLASFLGSRLSFSSSLGSRLPLRRRTSLGGYEFKRLRLLGFSLRLQTGFVKLFCGWPGLSGSLGMLLSLSVHPALKQGRRRGVNPWCDLYGKQSSCSHAMVLGKKAVFSLLCVWGKWRSWWPLGMHEWALDSLAPKLGEWRKESDQFPVDQLHSASFSFSIKKQKHFYPCCWTNARDS